MCPGLNLLIDVILHPSNRNVIVLIYSNYELTLIFYFPRCYRNLVLIYLVDGLKSSSQLWKPEKTCVTHVIKIWPGWKVRKHYGNTRFYLSKNQSSDDKFGKTKYDFFLLPNRLLQLLKMFMSTALWGSLELCIPFCLSFLGRCL